MLGFHIVALVFFVIGGLCLLVGAFSESDGWKSWGVPLTMAAVAAEMIFGIGWLISFIS